MMNSEIKSKKDVNKVLCKQLELLAEASEKCKEPDKIIEFSYAIKAISELLITSPDCFEY